MARVKACHCKTTNLHVAERTAPTEALNMHFFDARGGSVWFPSLKELCTLNKREPWVPSVQKENM